MRTKLFIGIAGLGISIILTIIFFVYLSVITALSLKTKFQKYVR